MSVRLICQSVLILFLLGCAHVNQPSITRHDIGGGWTVEIIPPEFAFMEIKEPAFTEKSDLLIIPADFDWVEVDSQNHKVRETNHIELIEVPAVYEDIIDNIIVEESKTKISVSPVLYNADGSILRPAIFEKIVTPAVTRQVKKRVVKRPREIIEVLGERREGYTRIVKTPTRVVQNPDFDYTEVRVGREKIQRRPRKFIIRNEVNVIVREFDDFDDFQLFLTTIK
ncbi:MAG: hypothetical protein ABJN69_05250 [Hellea sp.]